MNPYLIDLAALLPPWGDLLACGGLSLCVSRTFYLMLREQRRARAALAAIDARLAAIDARLAAMEEHR